MTPPRRLPREDEIPNASGICQCGCGKPAPIATSTGHKNFLGYAMKFIHGHNARKHSLTPGLCRCGCGEPLKPGGKRFKNYKRGHATKDQPLSGPNNPNWRGGRGQHKDGYMYRHVPKGHPLKPLGGHCLEHRVVVFESGFPLTTNDHVHHKDRNKQNNALENLEVTTIAAHSFLHSRDRLGWPARKSRIAELVAWARAILLQHGADYPEIS